MASSPLQVLLVDDNIRLLALLERLVKSAGYQVHACINGAEAWDWMSRNRVDVLVTDLNMPELDGPDLIVKVREAKMNTAILVLTGYPSPQQDEQLRDLGVDRILTKPDGVKELCRHIQEVCRTRGHLIPDMEEAQHTVPEQALEEEIQPTVLILEDDPIWSLLETRALMKNLTDVQIITCRSLKQAALVAEAKKIDVLLCDIYLPDGYGIEFICDLLSVQPTAKVVVISTSQVPLFRQRSEEIGVVRFLEKPVHPEVVIELVRDLLSKTTEARNEPLPQPRFTPTDIVQLKGMARANGILRFYSPRFGTGSFYLEEGRIVHASCGTQTGQEAIETIMSWRDVELIDQPLPPGRHSAAHEVRPS